ncbi:prepilin-type N-terminal cleavage/methylation domain-containing protein [Paenibacillus oryzisoli]|uniref:prepilin-type N-terminal cleavage/methylation domain-containing protein n=1 Tax=Paenibacillus oryzisoli TaxID=1850517 RepID=UPI003D26A49F
MNELTMEIQEKKSLRFPRLSKFSLKELNKNQKGLTLIELLAVIVIIAIIAAIAIPSIGGILKNTRVSAHKSNAHMIIDSTRTMVTGQGMSKTEALKAAGYTLDDLNKGGFLETVPKDPSNKPEAYDATNSKVVITEDANGNYVYTITLVGKNAVNHITAQKEEDIDGLKFGTTAADVQE